MTLPEPSEDARLQSRRLESRIAGEIAAGCGWISFARYMELALYCPGLGYYSGGAHKLGAAGDFVTAPELSPLFGQALAVQVAQVLAAVGGDVLEFGAGTGSLAADLAIRFSGKFGISAEWDDLKLGATITTPSFALKQASGGTDYASVNSNNVLVDTTTGAPIDILASDRQEGLPVNYRSPFSISAGIDYKISEETLVHFAAEWFAPLSTYVVMQP